DAPLSGRPRSRIECHSARLPLPKDPIPDPFGLFFREGVLRFRTEIKFLELDGVLRTSINIVVDTDANQLSGLGAGFEPSRWRRPRNEDIQASIGQEPNSPRDAL